MRQVQNFIREQKMIMPGDFVVAGVSGGADSVCLFFELLDCQKEIPFLLEVVHIEHGIRGQDSLADANYVENLCKEYGVPFRLFSCDIKKMARESGLTVEEAGRKARYQAFEQAAEESGKQNCKIAVAHNLDDQAETILMNLARGSGLKGLGGIRPVRGNIIRPLLNTRRSEIEAALLKRQVAWRTDETNRQTEYTRNKIRLEILPLLTQGVNEQAASHIAQAGLYLQEAEDYLRSQVQKLAERYVHCEADGEPKVFLEREGFCDQEHLMQEYLIRFCLEKMVAGQKDISRRHIGALLELAAGQNGKSLNLPGGIRAVNKNEFLVFEKNRSIRKETGEASEHRGETLQIPGVTRWGDLRIKADILPYEKQIIPQKKCTKWFDYDTINHKLEIRTRQAGDSLGIHAEGGTKSLKRYMIDEKILREVRDAIPLIADGSRILWVVGYRISEAYKVTESTKRILQIQIDKEK